MGPVSHVKARQKQCQIAEYDGQQTPTQAEQIAYLDAFVSVLETLPHNNEGAEDWLSDKISAAKKRFLEQGIGQPQ